MLPEDSKSRRALSNEMLRQTSVDDHFKPTTAEDKPIPYSDETFKQAAIEWLIETNQVSTIVYGATGLNTATFVQKKVGSSKVLHFLILLYKMFIFPLRIDGIKRF
jgi:hypothetical protein